MQKLIFVGAMVLGVGVLAVPGTASAYSTRIEATTSCRASADAGWTVQWTVVAGDYPDVEWEINGPAASSYTPATQQPANQDFTKAVEYPGSQLDATESVVVTWSEGSSGSASGSIDRPPVCEGSSTTTTTTTTTTTVPEDTTTTTVPEDTTTTTVPEDTTTTTEPEEGPEESTTTTEPAEESTTTTEPEEAAEESTTTTEPGDTTTPTDVGEAEPDDPTDSGGTPDSSGPDLPADGGPTLPATGRDGVKDMLTAALLLFGFGGLTISVARGRRSELLDY